MNHQVDRINVGCGKKCLDGYLNIDGSPGVWLARYPVLGKLLLGLRLIDRHNYEFMRFAANHTICYANAAGRLPLPTNSVAVVYSCHMYEHLLRPHAHNFLREAHRVLRPGGVIRLAVPDLRRKAEEYIQKGDADEFLEATLLCGVWDKLATSRGVLQMLLFGHPSTHKWMYDGPSLCRELARHDFVDPQVMPPGVTTIPDPGPLDLQERWPDSVFVEAVKPPANPSLKGTAADSATKAR